MFGLSWNWVAFMREPFERLSWFHFDSSLFWWRKAVFLGYAELRRSVATINSDICPVLKHGPRSLTHVRVCGLKIHMRNESDHSDCALAYTQLWPTLIFGDRFEYEHIR